VYLTTNEKGERVLVTSASDLSRAADCEFAVARDLDAKLDRLPKVQEPADLMLERTAVLGNAHEEAIIAELRAEHGDDGLVHIPRGGGALDEVAPYAKQTLAALQRGVPVIAQGTFLDLDHAPAAGTGEAGDMPIAFVGYADFLVRMPDGAYRVQDSKLARRAKVPALLQLAAYAEQLERLGIPVDPEVQLILGNRELSTHRLDDIAPVLRARRARLHDILRARLTADEPLAWRDPSVTYCRKCAWCALEVEAHDDVAQVAGLTGAQWTKLAAAGIETLAQLAESRGPIATIAASTLDTLRLQAALQLEASQSTDGALPPVTVRDAAPLHALPPESPGDLYFDFEGDPLYTEHDPARWGLDYLFGMVDVDNEFTPYWAYSFAEERDALLAFLADVEARRAIHPDLHVYHYAAYERTHLRSLSARHGVGEDIVDEWLRSGVLVDLYPVVTRALRIGAPSYSIKSVEKIYWPDARKDADLAAGDDSVAMYVDARELRAQGDAAAAQTLLDTIRDYNRVDCESTLRLAAWLRGLREQHPAPASALAEGDDAEADRDGSGRDIDDSPLRTELLQLAANPDGTASGEPDRSAEQRAHAYAAAAIDYHRREDKTFWWEHFDRLVADLRDWADVRDVFVVDPDAPHESTPWGKSGRQRSLRRTLTLHGTWAPGSRPSPGGPGDPFALYDQPAPIPSTGSSTLARAFRSVTLDDVGDGVIVITETLHKDAEPYSDLPVALTPGPPPKPYEQKPAIEEWGASLVAAHPEWPAEPVGDLLRRVTPRTRSGASLAQVVDGTDGEASAGEASAGEPDRVVAVVASLLDLDRSYLAVQGPPGTGKTYLGSRVIATLVRDHGWKVGVVAQSHATVEHVLAEVVTAGLDSRLVGKAPKSSADPADYATVPWTVLGKSDQLADFTAGRPEGHVIGGTAWDFAHPQRVGRRSLDLLVIDEAGQFSLAATIAASMSAKNLLLLGDPQQLPQVSQGTHPEPIDGSALGYLSAGHDVLPAELGYFLAETRRLHPALAEPVSRLSYEGKLHAHPSSSRRRLDGVAPGLHPVLIEHHGNATESVEEAEEVEAIIRNLIGTAWNPGPDKNGTPLPDRPLGDDDVIVVTPYNAQQQCIRERLDAAGLRGTRVGTVDKFQGQEAAVAIVSLAASSSRDAPRGMEFLLSRNRLNVAISRAQWAAYLVHSPGLLDSLPPTPHGVAELSAFIRLTEQEPHHA